MKIRLIKNIALSVLILLALLCTAFFVLRALYPQRYSEHVSGFAQQYGIDESLVYAIIKCESNFDKNALSHAGARGLMQITKETYEWAADREKDEGFNQNSLFDPATNIRYGCAIYSILQSEFSEPAVSLAAYNAGRGRVITWLSNAAYSADGKTLDVIPFAETERYVKKVLNTQKIYKLIY